MSCSSWSGRTGRSCWPRPAAGRWWRRSRSAAPPAHSGSARTRASRCNPAPRRSPAPRASAPSTGSTPAATASSTTRCTSSPSPGPTTTRTPGPTSRASRRRARPRRERSAASSGTWRAASTACLPPSREPSTRSKQRARRPRRPTPTGWKHRRRRAHTHALPQLEPRYERRSVDMDGMCDGRLGPSWPGVGTSSAQARRWAALACKRWSLRRPQVTIVMGLDQHRAQITCDWIDTTTGEISRARVRPADRAHVRRLLGRFRGRQLEVALEATTGWRFVVEELRRVGARVHLAEPAETAARRGNKKRAKNDRADARHLRELLMIKRLPESWIPPDHILDLRARVRLRHTLSEQRGEWQQRIQAVLYHHGLPQRRNLMTDGGREWLVAQALPATGREQITVAIAMIDALETQLAPIDKQLRSYARRQ